MGLVVFCRHSSHLTHLEAEVAYYRQELRHERQRAERAIDTLLTMTLGAPLSVTPPDRAPEDEIAQWQRELLKSQEFVQAGSADG